MNPPLVEGSIAPSPQFRHSTVALDRIFLETSSMFPCPNCGEPVADNAVACRECGSDADTGWREDPDYYSIELPEDSPPRSGPPWTVTLTIVLLLCLALGGIWRVADLGGQGLALAGLLGFIILVEVLYSMGILKRSFFRGR